MPETPIRYTRSADGVQIAWTESGSGARPLVWAANHISDFKYDTETGKRDALERLAQDFRLIRYDHRGSGSSERNVARHCLAAWVEDLEAVIEAASPREPCVVFAPSQASPYGAAFAAKRPDLISHLILMGAYPCGAFASGNPDLAARYEAMLELIRLDWTSPHMAARMFVTATLLPEPRPEDLAFAQRLPQMMNAEDAVRFFRADGEQDARDWLPKIRTPTLVIATADDPVVLPEYTRLVAAAIPGAQYFELPGANHVPVAHDPSFEPLFEHIHNFVAAPPAEDRLADLSERERDILNGVCAGLSNEAIALQRNISTKTVRNHLTRIFDKMRVNSRTQAALVATGSG